VSDRVEWFRKFDPAKRPIWVAEVDGRVVATAYLSSFYAGRPAYDATAEVSQYIATAYHRRGLGRRLKGAMMKLSLACGYALLALEHLARGDGRSATSHQIAEARGVPEEYLRKVLTPLARAGLVLSVKGVGGGYRLARPATGITLLEVVEAVGGPLRVHGSLALEGGERLEARLGAVCQEVADLVRKRLREARLSDLVGKGKG
jgi:Rrf2 family protein